jgi:hypothetical protein
MMDGRDKKMTAAHRARTRRGHAIPGRFLRLRLRPRRWIFCLATCWSRIPTSHASAMTSSTPSLQRPQAPALVLSPLLTPIFDAIDLARYLSQRGYRGRYLALVDRLPSANLIRREVEAQSPI